ncbi:uncharacterized protein LOC128739859 [Sabethes cyaneus]|uniref:uncharacterized protein LOC128739859 n=1 Tax=Sabethes cyaneus TaxID=53552 RepID=UPI00237D535C|nr:uncharacterized protein LOC128739859 [Sabethes cyaneus]
MPAAKSKLPSLKSLQTKLRGLQTSFDNMCRFMEQYRDDTRSAEVNVRLEQLDRLWDKMNEAIDDVESHEESIEEADSFVKNRIDFENRFYELKAFLVGKQREDCDQTVLNQTTRSLDNPPGPTPHVRLPQITLPKFSGKIDEWLTFRDLFTSLIHRQTDLPEIEKFHYLRSQLEGEALSIIDSLPLIKANYTVAWELLTKRYSNTKVLRKRQVQALFELPTIRRESASELNSLLDNFEKIVKSLDQVTPQQTDYKDMLLVHLLCSRLDHTTRRGWEEFSSTKESDTIKDLTEFLQRRARILESVPTKPSEIKAEYTQPKRPNKIATVKAYNASVQRPSTIGTCVSCSDNHLLYQCPSFQKLSVSERDALLRSHSLCRNCFRRGHHAKECNSKFTCRQCKGKHHTLVCFRSKATEEKPKPNGEPTSTVMAAIEEVIEPKVVNLATTSKVACNTASSSPTGVFLLTAIVTLVDDRGQQVHARALLDSAAECNLISDRMRKYLTVKEQPCTVEVVGIQGLSSKVQRKITVMVQSRFSEFSQPMEMYILPKIAAQVAVISVDVNQWNLPSGIELADPTFFKGGSVDLVLGAEAFFDFFTTGRKIRLGNNLPSLVDSVFGWVVTGKCSVAASVKSVVCDLAINYNLDNLLEKFWESEDIGQRHNYSPEESRCMEYFTKTTRRQPSGRYTVSYPRNDELLAKLGDSKEIAERRFLQIEKRLGRDEKLREQYANFMKVYESMGHMKLIDDEHDTDVKRCFLPHHPVVKEDSTTTKVRVVFDASAKTSSNVSLNDSLLVGPVIQEDLRSIILRSRTRQVMVVADIEKMFRQIEIHPEDRQFQCILWRTSPNVPLSTYELSTVTYGTKPAPFLATRVLMQLATDEEKRFPLASTAVREDFYMDDVITGADDPVTATDLRIQLQEMLRSGGFWLRKFASNCETVLVGLPEEELAIQADDGINLDPDPMFMADLPASRVTAARPFSTTGVDYFGPVYIRSGYRRTAVKAYVSVFVCFVTKATHLELVTDLSTARFIQALRRFTSRRGKCATLWSDNGTNFVGAKNQMRELLKILNTKEHHQKVAKECADDGMQWKFIPPGAPHFGGLWEAAVRSAKKHLLKVLADTPVSYEDMTTLLTQVECCLNSRPLTQLSDDPDDLRPLTPGHFLVGSALQSIPSADYTDTAYGRLKTWEAVQKRLQDFWRRWKTEYLNQLQGRVKWWKPPVGIRQGSLAVIRDDNLPPTKWRMARIISTHPGPDGVVRVVTLRTANGTVDRPVDKICILPVATNDGDLNTNEAIN